MTGKTAGSRRSTVKDRTKRKGARRDKERRMEATAQKWGGSGAKPGPRDPLGGAGIPTEGGHRKPVKSEE